MLVGISSRRIGGRIRSIDQATQSCSPQINHHRMNITNKKQAAVPFVLGTFYLFDLNIIYR